VIAFNRGAAPEIVLDGRTGFVVQDTDGMVAAVDRISQIDPRDCRENVERRFDGPIMAANYVAAYQRVVESERTIVPVSTNGTRRLEETTSNGRTTARVA
jgi:glycosyltransferase involved in cell wall biosynthesis